MIKKLSLMVASLATSTQAMSNPTAGKFEVDEALQILEVVALLIRGRCEHPCVRKEFAQYTEKANS